MRMLATSIAILFAVGGSMILGPVVHAEDAPVAASPSDRHQGMMNGDMKAMMNMMGQMNQMMESCNRMMLSKNDRQEGKSPPKKEKQ